jgi:hypothetical protein
MKITGMVFEFPVGMSERDREARMLEIWQETKPEMSSAYCYS